MSEKIQSLTEELRAQHIESLISSPSLEKLDYTFDMPLEGDGWHPRETNGEIYWRFTGPGQNSSLFFSKINARQATLKIHIFHAITDKHIDELSIKYNGHKLKLNSRQDNIVTFKIPAEAINTHRFVQLEFHTPPTIKPAQGDDRLLGIGLKRIEVF